MKTTIILLATFIGLSSFINGPGEKKMPIGTTPSIVDFDAFEKLTVEVNKFRKDRLVDVKNFLKMSKEPGTIILDTRSDSMYKRKHVKGALHLDFTDFTQGNLARVIPSTATRILIYCNNNFLGDQNNFATKGYSPPRPVIGEHKPLSLALNIPTFINLYGYGYKNIYELGELVTIGFPLLSIEPTTTPLEFEGTDVLQFVQKKKGSTGSN